MIRELVEIDAIAARAHEGQFDKGGQPYIEHPRAVACILAERGCGFTLQAAALLHDVLEDTYETPETLLAQGVPPDVVRIVEAVTRRVVGEDGTKEPYQTHLDRVATDPRAIVVKLADLYHNTDPARRFGQGDEHHRLMVRYDKARQFLEHQL